MVFRGYIPSHFIEGSVINLLRYPGLKLKKRACNLQAYYWHGLKYTSSYNTLADIDFNSLITAIMI